MASERATRRGGRLGAGAVVLALASAGTVAVSSARSHSVARAQASESSIRSMAVGPQQSSGAVVPAPAAAMPGGAAQVVSGTVQSTSGVQLSSTGGPTYFGTEPATMTLERRTHELIVTVAPR